MVALCGVCSNEPSKYRCPTCNLSSCSLACSQAHKPNCQPQPAQPSPSQHDANHDTTQKEATPLVTQSNEQSSSVGHNGNVAASQSSPVDQQDTARDFDKLEKSPELQELWRRYPKLRSQLHDIYKVTLEGEWVENSEPTGSRGRGHGRGRYKGSHSSRGNGPRNRGPWTVSKGFNRGLGKVKHWRDHCDDGASGTDNEGFMRFVSLVLAEKGPQGQGADMT